jgi:uncharacterized membrane protein
MRVGVSELANFLTDPKNRGYIATIIAIVIVVAIALLSNGIWNTLLITVVCVGAIGGLAHELVQSGGKYMLPAEDATGNLCLGGLVGLVEGGIAGVILMQGQTAAVAGSQSLFISAFLAGLALKGVSDSVNNYTPDTTTQPKKPNN